MTEGYRESARPTARVVRLESLDLARVWRTLLVFAGCVVVDIVVALMLVAHPLAVAVSMVVLVIATLAMLLFGLRSATKLRYLLENEETEVRLLGSNRERLASTADATLRFEKVNYVRKARYRAYLRPGYRATFPGGTTVIGTLYPDLPWDDKPTVDTIPDHELEPAELEALAGTLRLPK